ncbi:RNA polymerase sigma factor [Streptomyces olivaceus]|uniref:RNA polymerase sigma factor n=1 Tax=Streptomyces TaxID=1883 RepID=UPI0004CC1332|nr:MULTISPECIES: sigma-70 family RNA polymerase sigma factor [Streptomyces]MBZ6107413.1 sigma-70 family RNA polymerase sigma factor [Streptomyces olivaceus]MCU8592160.1 sigma-70 family RNA polymerase sigma factor [Streptomyces sp. A13(2022)]
MDGELGGFGAFFADHYPRVIAMLVAHRGFTEVIAQDATAEAMTRLVEHWGKVEAPQAWVRTVAFRVACQLAGHQQTGMLASQLVDHRAAHDLVAAELALVAGTVIAALPRRQQEVMTLTLVDMKPSEIADILGCTPAQARANLAHARRALRNAIRMDKEA